MAHNIQITCEKCKLKIRVNNFKKHSRVCNGSRKRKIRGVDFDPNSGYKDGTRKAWNLGLTKRDHPSIASSAKLISEKMKGKQYHPLTDYGRESLSKSTSQHLLRDYASGHRKQAGGHVKRFQYGEFLVQGTYELRACKILDKLKELGEIKNWSYSTTRLKYFSKIYQRERTYIVDFTIIKFDGVHLLEVKGRIKDEDFEKWEAAKQKFPFEVWYKNDISKKEKTLGL